MAGQSYSYWHHPQVGKTAERRGSVTCPQVQAGKWRGWILTQGILTSEAMLCKPTVREGKTASRPQGGDRRPTWVSSRKGAGYIPPNQRNHKNGTMCVSEAGLLSPFWTGSAAAAAAKDTRHLVTSGKNLNVLVPHPPPGGPQPQEEEGGISNQGELLWGPYWHLGLDALFSRT